MLPTQQAELKILETQVQQLSQQLRQKDMELLQYQNQLSKSQSVQAADLSRTLSTLRDQPEQILDPKRFL